MNNNLIFALYYLYAMIVICIFSYAVFWLDKSGWYFLLCLLLLQITPSIENRKTDE